MIYLYICYEQAICDVEEEILKAHQQQAAFSILLQRPSFTGAERFKLNELEEKPEQEEGKNSQARERGGRGEKGREREERREVAYLFIL